MKFPNWVCGLVLIIIGACTLFVGQDPVTGYIDCTAFIFTVLLGGSVIIRDIAIKFKH